MLKALDDREVLQITGTIIRESLTRKMSEYS